MRRITYDDTMSSTDALIWHIERDPLLRSTVMSVWFLERPPLPERMHATVEHMAAELPRLRQRVLSNGPRPRWVPVDDFSVRDHYRYDDLGGDAHAADVLQHAEAWLAEPFDRARPLWQLGIFSGMADGRAALVLKVHHSIADGVGLMLMLAALADLEPNPPRRLVAADFATEPPAVPPRERAPRITGLMRAAAACTSRFVRHPAHSTRTATRSIRSVARLVMPSPRPMSTLMTGRSSELRLDVKTVPLDTLRHAGKHVGGSLNDAFVTLVLDALDRYHARHGEQCDRLRVHMPINIRNASTADRAGNQFVPARIVMAVGGDVTGEHGAGRLRRVSNHLAAVRREPALPWVNNVSAAIQRLGVPISRRIVGAMMKGVDVLASNVAGPPCALYLAGVHVEEFYAFGPPTGAALNITLFSYDNTVHLGVTTVAAAINARETLMDCLDEAITEMEALAAAWRSEMLPAAQAASARVAA